MALPRLLGVGVQSEGFAGVNYWIEGELVPVLSVDVGQEQIYFEHHILLWKDPGVNVKLKSIKGALKRAFAGIPVFMTMTQGEGRVAFSRDGAGHILGVHLAPGESIEVREHQFLAATESVEYGFTTVKGLANILFSASGFIIDSFKATNRDGIVWLHAYGNLFEVTLDAGEQVDVEPGAWVYKSPSVKLETKVQGLSSGLFGGSGQLTWNRFTGPGKLGIQSMSLYVPESK